MPLASVSARSSPRWRGPWLSSASIPTCARTSRQSARMTAGVTFQRARGTIHPRDFVVPAAPGKQAQEAGRAQHHDGRAADHNRADAARRDGVPGPRGGHWTGQGSRRQSFAETGVRVARLANALRELGVTADQRVATLMWNNAEHLEAYLAVPSMGAVLHTLNLRLAPAEIGYIATHAGDEIVIADA